MIPRAVTISQGELELRVPEQQLTELADKLFFLDRAFHTDAEDIVEALCTN